MKEREDKIEDLVEFFSIEGRNVSDVLQSKSNKEIDALWDMYIDTNKDYKIFKFYVLNYDINQRKIINYNIFNNIHVNEYTEKAIKKYLRAPSKYKYVKDYGNNESVTLNGFDALVEEIKHIIMWQEWSRCEYEICVSGILDEEAEKWDCYQQALPNIETITRECIYQYKQYLKSKKENNE